MTGEVPEQGRRADRRSGRGRGTAGARVRNFVWALAVILIGLAWPTAGRATPEQAPDSVPLEFSARARDLAGERARGGYGDLTPLARLWSDRARAGGPDARAWARLAAEAAPDDPTVHARLAAFSLTEMRLGTALAEVWAGFVALVCDPWVQGAGLARLGATVSFGAWFAVLALIFVGGVPRAACVLHDYADSFPSRLRRWTPLMFGALTVAVMYLAGVGPAVFPWLAGLILCPYLPKRGRVAVGTGLAVACLVGVGLGTFASLGGESGHRAWTLYRAWKGDRGGDLAEQVARAFPPGDPRALYVRARLCRRDGDLDRAGLLLAGCLDAGGDAGRARLELGNVAFLQGRYGEALEQYRAASMARPKDPVPWLNRHIAHLARLELADADEALERARALDAGSAARHDVESQAGAGRLLPVSDPLPGAWVRGELLGGMGRRTSWVTALEQGLFLPVPGVRAWYFGAFALLFAGLVRRSEEERRSHRCPSCGFVVCPRCSRRVKGTLLCPGCWTASREKEADQAEKERRAADTRRWYARCRRWGRVGRLAFPGWSGFLGDLTTQGAGRQAVLGVAWALAAGWLAVWLLFPAPWLPWGDAGVPWAAVAVLAATHAVGARQAVRISGGER